LPTPCVVLLRRPPSSPRFPYTTLFRSIAVTLTKMGYRPRPSRGQEAARMHKKEQRDLLLRMGVSGAIAGNVMLMAFALYSGSVRSEEHTSELQSRENLVCRLLLEKKKN